MRKGPRRARDVVALGAALALAALAGCKPAEGKSCGQESRETCVDPKTALACHGGHWERMTCRGKDGCRQVGSEGVCDQSVAADGEVCNLEADVLCAADARSMLECKRARWVKSASCLGPTGCALDGKTVRCDNTVANPGDGCTRAVDYACSADGKLELVCQDGKFVVSATCRGPKACAVAQKKVHCDDTRAALNDACHKDGSHTCDMDARAVLVCRGGHYVLDETCAGRLGCRVLEREVGCF